MGKDWRQLLQPHLDLHLEVFVPKKKEIAAAAGGWGVTEYLQLDWMDDGTDGWKEKASQPRLYVMGLVSEMPVHHMVTGPTSACSRAQLVATGASHHSSVHTSVGQLLETGTEPWWLSG
jgi:hypothetical protein